ncbi:cupredoxin domain-containing protein [Streptomyces sp. CA-135486]|uniref:cupredoxin domain-containing protein n=1 Tax=Streptomyces sp. CA-135486 TaxID=3240049 RepID=UPI003D8E4C6E
MTPAAAVPKVLAHEQSCAGMKRDSVGIQVNGAATGRTALASATEDGEPEWAAPDQRPRPDHGIPRRKGPPGMSLTYPHRVNTALRVAGACVLLALAGCSNNGNDTTSASSAPSTSNTGAAHISIKNFTFSPANLQVRPGTKVIVENLDSVTHTVTATGEKAFDTGSIDAGETATFIAPSTSGSYPYICTIHPTMKGTVTVS